MTVEELIEELRKLPPKHEVWVSADAEGNNFSPMSKTHSFALRLPLYELSFEDEQEKSFGASNSDVVVLWP